MLRQQFAWNRVSILGRGGEFLFSKASSLLWGRPPPNPILSGYRASSLMYSDRGVKLVTHLHSMLMYKISGVTLTLPHTPSSRTETTFLSAPPTRPQCMTHSSTHSLSTEVLLCKMFIQQQELLRNFTTKIWPQITRALTNHKPLSDYTIQKAAKFP